MDMEAAESERISDGFCNSPLRSGINVGGRIYGHGGLKEGFRGFKRVERALEEVKVLNTID